MRVQESTQPVSSLSAALAQETGEFVLTLEAEPASHQRIDVSKDLVEWHVLITVTIGGEGIESFRDPTAVGKGRLFYRAVEVAANPLAAVNSIEISGDEGAYQMLVEISSQDTGCEQYADWWEVLREDGRLLYRRILTHSHVNEQPFTRSGGPVPVNEDEVIVVRAHMFPSGYGPTLMRGSVQDGFVRVEADSIFAGSLVLEGQLPTGCGF